jgi:hypothetical protein
MSHEGVEKVRGSASNGAFESEACLIRNEAGFRSGAIIFETKRWLDDETEALA